MLHALSIFSLLLHFSYLYACFFFMNALFLYCGYLQNTKRCMGNWSDRQEERKETQKRNDVRREKLAGYFFDLSKLSFAGLVIGLVLPIFSNVDDVTIWFAGLFGLILTVVSALMANKILK